MIYKNVITTLFLCSFAISIVSAQNITSNNISNAPVKLQSNSLDGRIVIFDTFGYLKYVDLNVRNLVTKDAFEQQDRKIESLKQSIKDSQRNSNSTSSNDLSRKISELERKNSDLTKKTSELERKNSDMQRKISDLERKFSELERKVK